MQAQRFYSFLMLVFLCLLLAFDANAQDQSALKAEIFCQTAQYLSRDAQKQHNYSGCYPATIEKNSKDLPEKSRELLDKWQIKKADKDISANNFADEIFALFEKNRKKRLAEPLYIEFKSKLKKLLENYAHSNVSIEVKPVDSLALLKMQVLELKIELDNTERVLRHENKKAIDELRSETEFYVWIMLALLVLSFAMIFVKNRKITPKRIADMEAKINQFSPDNHETTKNESAQQ